MSAAPSRTRFEQNPVLITYPDTSAFKETYGGASDRIVLEGFHLRRPDATNDTVCVFMHPTATLHLLPLPRTLARLGVPVLCCASRYPHNDSALIVEKVLIDLGQVVRHAREELGYKRVVLAGWSGGGPLSVYYQSQAQNPTVTATLAGEPIDLRGLTRADGMMQLAAHASRASILTEWMDPSILDEQDPTKKDPDLDLYGLSDGPRPPYDPAFVARFREAQVERNRRITTWVQETLADLQRRNGPDVERAFVTHGTMADPRWLDPSIEPNERVPGRCYLGDPAVVNNGPVGLARFSTLRSWLSQWSIDSHASADRQGRHVTVPSLVIQMGADDACPPSHTDRIFASLGGEKERRLIAGADHYLWGREHVTQAAETCIDWMTRKGLLDGVPGQ